MVEAKNLRPDPEELARLDTHTKSGVPQFTSPADQVIELLKEIQADFLDSSVKGHNMKARIKAAIG